MVSGWGKVTVWGKVTKHDEKGKNYTVGGKDQRKQPQGFWEVLLGGPPSKPSLHHNKHESRENWDVFLSNWFESLQFQRMMVCSIFKVV